MRLERRETQSRLMMLTAPLVAILVAVAMLRGSGAMEIMVTGLSPVP